MTDQDRKRIIEYLRSLQKAHEQGLKHSQDEFSNGYHSGSWNTLAHIIDKIGNESIK